MKPSRSQAKSFLSNRGKINATTVHTRRDSPIGAPFFRRFANVRTNILETTFDEAISSY